MHVCFRMDSTECAITYVRCSSCCPPRLELSRPLIVSDTFVSLPCTGSGATGPCSILDSVEPIDYARMEDGPAALLLSLRRARAVVEAEAKLGIAPHHQARDYEQDVGGSYQHHLLVNVSIS